MLWYVVLRIYGDVLHMGLQKPNAQRDLAGVCDLQTSRKAEPADPWWAAPYDELFLMARL